VSRIRSGKDPGVHAHIRAAALFSMLCACAVAPDHNPLLLEQLRQEGAGSAIVVANRGASEVAPENTLVAFRLAVQQGAPVVEFDVQQTKDGHWVCMHDETLDRTTDAEEVFERRGLRVADLTLSELRQLDAGSWRGEDFVGERLPTLDEALQAILPSVPMIERKAGSASDLAGLLGDLAVADRVIVQAFDWTWLRAFHAAAPEALVAALGSKQLTADRLEVVVATGADIVHWDSRHLGAEEVIMARSIGMMVCCYTVDRDLEIAGSAAMGCELITTNRPRRALRLRELGLLSTP
jgi:glycerophosphoryl diester phosphodiesterase